MKLSFFKQSNTLKNGAVKNISNIYLKTRLFEQLKSFSPVGDHFTRIFPTPPGLFSELVLSNSTSHTNIVLSQAAADINLSPFGDQAKLMTGLWSDLCKI